MTNIINLTAAAPKPTASPLCQTGFHKWQTVKNQPFKVHDGKLLTAERWQSRWTITGTNIATPKPQWPLRMLPVITRCRR